MLAVGLGVRCIAAETSGVESFPLRLTGNAPPGFTLMPPAATGINFSNFVSGQTRSLYTLIPTGIAAGDVDGDGLCDLYFCSSDGTNVLYRNLGNWKFADITASAGVACLGQHSIGATFADVNGEPSRDRHGAGRTEPAVAQ
jgi:hypothetical protein